MVVTGNATVIHPANTTVNVEIEAVGRDDYVIRLTTEPTNETKGSGPQQTGWSGGPVSRASTAASNPGSVRNVSG